MKVCEACGTLLYGDVPPLQGYIRSPVDAAAIIRPLVEGEKREHFVVLYLDAKHRLIGEPYVASIGSLDAAIVHPREVFAPALERRASAIIVTHLHPSGDPSPSSEDIEVTRRLREVGDIMSIRVVDHVIVCADRHFSFRDAYGW